MSSDYSYEHSARSERRSKHRHHHHHKSSAKKSASSTIKFSLDEDGGLKGMEDAGQSISKWRHEAHVKDHEIKILRQMVENAKTEIQRKEQTVAKMVERIPAFQNENKGLSKEALDMIETLERKLSEREYQTLKVQQDLESAQAAVTERNERIHDLCLQWEKSTQMLKEARERDLAELHKQIRHLEDELIPGLRARADAAEAREKQLRNELVVAQARIKQIEAMAQEKLAQKERQLSEATRRIRELELDLEHVMAAAARYTRREVLVEHLGGHLQNTMVGQQAQQPSPYMQAGLAQQTPYTPVGSIYQQIGPEAFVSQSAVPPQSASHPPGSVLQQPNESSQYVQKQRAVPVQQPGEPGSTTTTPQTFDQGLGASSSVGPPGTSTSAPAYGQRGITPVGAPQAVPQAMPTPIPAAPIPAAAAPPMPPRMPPMTSPPPMVPPHPPRPPAAPPAPMVPPRAPSTKASPSSKKSVSFGKSATSSSERKPSPSSSNNNGNGFRPEVLEMMLNKSSPKPPPLPGQQTPMMMDINLPPQSQQQPGGFGSPPGSSEEKRIKYSFQDLPENSPRHRLSVIMRKLKDPTMTVKT